jgi:hypothetical protein
MSMNLCHVVALALVGWYLMTPPLGEDPKMCHALVADDSQPVLDWDVDQSFNCLESCKAAHSELVKHKRLLYDNASAADSNRGKCGTHKTIAARQADFALADYTAARKGQCVASDDPRLKGREPTFMPSSN